MSLQPAPAGTWPIGSPQKTDSTFPLVQGVTNQETDGTMQTAGGSREVTALSPQPGAAAEAVLVNWTDDAPGGVMELCKKVQELADAYKEFHEAESSWWSLFGYGPEKALPTMVQLLNMFRGMPELSTLSLVEQRRLIKIASSALPALQAIKGERVLKPDDKASREALESHKNILTQITFVEAQLKTQLGASEAVLSISEFERAAMENGDFFDRPQDFLLSTDPATGNLLLTLKEASVGPQLRVKQALDRLQRTLAEAVELNKLPTQTLTNLMLVCERMILNYARSQELRLDTVPQIMQRLTEIREIILGSFADRVHESTEELSCFIQGASSYFVHADKMTSELREMAEYPEGFVTAPVLQSKLAQHANNLALYLAVRRSKDGLHIPGHDNAKFLIADEKNGLRLYLLATEEGRKLLLFVRDEETFWKKNSGVQGRDIDCFQMIGNNGVLSRANELVTILEERFQELRDSDSIDTRGLPLTVIGYGFSGAVAQLIAYQQAQLGRECDTFTFAAPDFLAIDDAEKIKDCRTLCAMNFGRSDDAYVKQSALSQQINTELGESTYTFPVYNKIDFFSDKMEGQHSEATYVLNIGKTVSTALLLAQMYGALSRFKETMSEAIVKKDSTLIQAYLTRGEATQTETTPAAALPVAEGASIRANEKRSAEQSN